MTCGAGAALWEAMMSGDTATLDRIGPDPRGAGFLDAVALCPAATVRWFLDHGADPDMAVDDGFPALHLAIDRTGADRAEVMALLLRHGADVNRRGVNDWTPLHRAACTVPAPLDLIALLIDHGADRALRTRIDACATPEDEARLLGRTEAADFLRDCRGAPQ